MSADVPVVKKKSYALTIRVTFPAMDDCEARDTARQVLQDPSLFSERAIKLQEVFENAQPRRAELWL